MKEITYTCDKCGQKIEGVVYTLTCYAEDATPHPYGGLTVEASAQNNRQNIARQTTERHLCKTCKDAITDGIFIV